LGTRRGRRDASRHFIIGINRQITDTVAWRSPQYYPFCWDSFANARDWAKNSALSYNSSAAKYVVSEDRPPHVFHRSHWPCMQSALKAPLQRIFGLLSLPCKEFPATGQAQTQPCLRIPAGRAGSKEGSARRRLGLSARKPIGQAARPHLGFKACTVARAVASDAGACVPCARASNRVADY
jgi:hypothetical protein